MAHLEPVIMFLQVQGESKPLLKGQRAEYRGVFGTIFTMVKTEGPRSLYSGLVAGLHRQMSFASVRIGMYDTMKELYTQGSESTSASKQPVYSTSGVSQPPNKFSLLNLLLFLSWTLYYCLVWMDLLFLSDVSLCYNLVFF